MAGKAPEGVSERLEAAGIVSVAPDGDLNAAREYAWPALRIVKDIAIGMGSLAPKLVIVADKDPGDRLPFYSKGGVWLFDTFRKLGWDELTVYFATAGDRFGHTHGDRLNLLDDAFARYEPVWLALGEKAHERLRDRGIKHIQTTHPAWHRKHRYPEGTDGYAKYLVEAGLPLGPWANKPLPETPATDELVSQMFLVPVTFNDKDSGHSHRLKIHQKDINAARTLYVTGEARTPLELCKMLGLDEKNKVHFSRMIQTEGWEIEREKHFEKVREKVKSTSAEQESKSILEARKLAWAAAQLGLARVLKGMSDKDARVRPQEAKALVDAALALSEKGDLGSEAERARLSSMDPVKLVKELQESCQAMFGDTSALGMQGGLADNGAKGSDDEPAGAT